MKKIGVLGTGTMGAGIIQVLAQHGYEVVMRARRESSVEKGLATVKKNLDQIRHAGSVFLGRNCPEQRDGKLMNVALELIGEGYKLSNMSRKHSQAAYRKQGSDDMCIAVLL